MNTVAEFIDNAVHSPRLPNIVATLTEVLRAEKVRREQFYETEFERKKVEFINGEIVIQKPAANCELTAVANLSSLLSAWVTLGRLGRVYLETCMCVFQRNDYMPDIVYFSPERSALTDTKIFPIPNFIVEVLSESTEKNDRGVKFEDYAAHGVREYWIIDSVKETVEQYLLRKQRYELALESSDGEVASNVIAGFRVPIRAIFDDEANRVALLGLPKPKKTRIHTKSSKTPFVKIRAIRG